MRTLEMVVESAPFSKITDDREFMKKFILLLSLIMGLSTYIIINAVNTVDDLSVNIDDRLPIITLEKIERQMNGNMISLEIVEDDFSELDSIIITREDLEELPLVTEVFQDQSLKEEKNLQKEYILDIEYSSVTKTFTIIIHTKEESNISLPIETSLTSYNFNKVKKTMELNNILEKDLLSKIDDVCCQLSLV